MSRYINEFATSYTPEQIYTIVNNFCMSEGFSTYNYNGEMLYKKGSGWVSAPQYIKVTNAGSNVRVEAFIKYAILPGVYVGEMGLTGFFGFAIKAALGTKVATLENALRCIV